MHRSHSWDKLILWVILLAAFALRVYRLGNQSFAFDEGWTSYAINHPWTGLRNVLAPDNHPPLYYVLVKAFAEISGYGDFPVRFFSVACDLLLVAGLYALGKRLDGASAGLSVTGAAAASFAACSPLLIYYAQEARMYSLLMVLGVFSSYSLVRLAGAPRCRRWWLAYVLTACGALYTHYFAALLLVTHNLVVLVSVVAGKRWRLLGRWLLGQLGILLLYLPWLPTAIRQVSIGQGTWWRTPLPAAVILEDIWRFFILGPRRPDGLRWFGPLMGTVSLSAAVGMLATPIVAVLAIRLAEWRRRAAGWAFAWAVLALPIAMVTLLGHLLPIYTDRYALVAAPGLAVVVGGGVAACWAVGSVKRLPLGRVAALVLLIAAWLGPLPQLDAYYHDQRYWREDFRRAAQYLMDKEKAGDTVVLLGCSQPIMQYYRGAAEVLRFPQRGDSVQGEEEVATLLRQHVDPAHHVRLVMFSWSTVDPRGLVEGQLRSSCELTGEHWQLETGEQPIRVLNYASCDGEFAPEPRQPILATWGDQVRLVGYRLGNAVPGERTQIVLWWQTLRRPDLDYTVFIHLLDVQDVKISQFDKLPLNDFYPMRAWPPQVDHRDEYLLPIPQDANLDGASLAIGLYDRRTGARLSVAADGSPVADHIRIPLEASPADTR